MPSGLTVATGKHLMDKFVPGYDAMVNAGFEPDFSDFSNSGVTWSRGTRGALPSQLASNSVTDSAGIPDVSELFSYVASELQPLVGQLLGIQNSNSALSREFAEDLRNWQYNLFQEQNEFNASEAAKNRDWQKLMSNTAHQREVKDLIKAGLNPVLSATGGNGASVTSGATASTSMPSGAMGSVDTSASGSIVSLLASMLSAQTNLAGQAVSALTNSSIADRNNSTSRYIADLNRSVAEKQIEASLSNANLSYLASLYGADSSKFASIVGSQLGYAASTYGSQLSYDASVFGSQTSAEASRYGVDVNAELEQKYPNNPWRMIASAGQTIAGLYGYDSPADAISASVNSGTRVVSDFLKKHTNLSSTQIYNITRDVGVIAHRTANSPNGFTATYRNPGSRSTWYGKLISNLQRK